MMQNKMLSWKDCRRPNITAETVKPYMERHGLEGDADSVADAMTEIFAGLQITETSAMFHELMDAFIRHDAESRRTA